MGAALLPRQAGQECPAHPAGWAMRSDQPGRVLAEAALRGETDSLADPDVRLFVGLLPPARP